MTLLLLLQQWNGFVISFDSLSSRFNIQLRQEMKQRSGYMMKKLLEVVSAVFLAFVDGKKLQWN